MSHRFDPTRYYCTDDNALRIIAARGTLAIWRHQARGPRYSKFGNRVLYLGADLNGWLDEHTVEPRAERHAPDAA